MKSLLTLAIASVATSALLLPTAHAQYSDANPLTVPFTEIAQGLSDEVDGIGQLFPTDLVAFPDGSDRLAISTLGGVVRLVGADRQLRAAPYLDTTSSVTINSLNGNFSYGMSTIMFHPDFANAGTPGANRFYTVEPEMTQVSPPPDFPGVAPDIGGFTPAHDRVLYEYTATNSSDDVFSGTKREVVRVHTHRQGHDVNDLAFDSAGYLLISVGDAQTSSTAQDRSVVFGSVLRIDPVDPAANAGSADPLAANGKYRIPLSNPFVGDAGALDELFAYGLRNPYRISIDRVTDQLLVTSNGGNQRESVYFVDAGDNLGWPFFEGSLPRITPPPGFTFRPPVFEYDRNLGLSINGGFTYRGSALPALAGQTVFADFLGAGAAGARLFYGDAAVGEFYDVLAAASGAPIPDTIVGMGEDAAGELYILSTDGLMLRLGDAPDMDGDGIADSADNCTQVANADQRDTNGDGFGNACDADLNNDGAINVVDLGLLRTAFFSTGPDADFNGDGIVNVVDLATMRLSFFGAPGPSGLNDKQRIEKAAVDYARRQYGS